MKKLTLKEKYAKTMALLEGVQTHMKKLESDFKEDFEKVFQGGTNKDCDAKLEAIKKKTEAGNSAFFSSLGFVEGSIEEMNKIKNE